MKLLILGDLHFGVKQDNLWMQKIQRLLIQQAIDYSNKNGIKRWIQTGDWFDVRKAITHATMEFTREIAELLDENGIEVDVIVGNHDMGLKHKINPNACTDLLASYPNFNVYDKPTTVDYAGVEIDLIPWICNDNKDAIMDFVQKTKSQYCVGHFELTGFYFYKGLKSHGDDPAFLRKYKQVWSGHFHTQSESRNVKYLGTPYTITSGDEDDVRGFHVFDTETEHLTLIQNPTIWHRRIDYPCSINPKTFEGLSVRVFIHELDKGFAKFETELESVVHEMKTVSKIKTEVDSDGLDGKEELDISQPMNILEMMGEHIESIPEISDADAIACKNMVKNLYMEVSK